MIREALSGPDYLATIPFQKPLFASPASAGRKITAGFSFLQRIGKSATTDVWFPDLLKRELDALVADGGTLGPQHFPAEWAAVRQFELLQESGNYKIYDMDVTHLTRSLMDMSRSMRAGGYRITVAMLGSYSLAGANDELAILDKRLQDRLSQLIHMLYLEEESRRATEAQSEALAAGTWDFRSALPHVGVTLGARDLFKKPALGHDLDPAQRRHKLSRHFFDILSLLPKTHIVHDTAIGLQLPEAISENEWIYLAPGDETLHAFNSLLTDLFKPFDGMSLGALHEREGAGSEVKATVQHMRGYGDRLTAEADQFFTSLAQLAL